MQAITVLGILASVATIAGFVINILSKWRSRKNEKNQEETKLPQTEMHVDASRNKGGEFEQKAHAAATITKLTANDNENANIKQSIEK